MPRKKLQENLSQGETELMRRVSALELFVLSLCTMIENSPSLDANTRRSANAIKLTLENTKL